LPRQPVFQIFDSRFQPSELLAELIDGFLGDRRRSCGGTVRLKRKRRRASRKR
jgi:hypothetical protein